MRKAFNACLIVLLVVSQFFSFPHSQVTAETTNLHTIFDSVEMKDSNNITINAATNPDTKVKPGSTVQLEYAWSLKENQTLTNTDSISLQIPNELQIQQDIQGGLLVNELEIGQYFVTASDNTIQLLFNEQSKQVKEGSGKITFAATFHPAVDTKKTTVQITFPLGATSQSITVPIETENEEQPATNELMSDEQPVANETVSTEVPTAAEEQLPSTETESVAAKEETGPQQITENILTSVTMTDKNGEPFDNKDNRPTTSDVAKIEFTWDLPNDVKAKSGDYYTFKLPEHFAIYNDVSGDLVDGDGESVGTYLITRDGKVTMTFNEYVETHSHIAGTLRVQTEFNKHHIKGSTTQEIHFPVTEEGVTIPVEFKPNVKGPMDKSGLPNKPFNANEINWTVNINKTKDTLTNAVMKDVIPTGLSLDTSSIEVYYLNVDIDGNTTLRERVDTTEYTVTSSNESNLEVAFKDTINQAYQIRYKTKITDDSKTSFTNKATLSSDNQQDTKANATVTASHGAHLNKKNKYNPVDQTITWTITYNGDEKTIKQQDALLKDLFDNSHELVEDSIVVNKAAYDDNGKLITGETVDNYTTTSQKNDKENGFNLQFNDDIHDTYVITYKTKPIRNVTTDNKIKNTITTGGGSTSSNTANTKQQNIIKSNTNVNYKDKTATWKIEINKNNYEMNNAVITDTFDHDGLTLHKDTFTITNRTTGQPLVEGEDYTLEVTKDGFKVTLTNLYASKMKDTLEITYTTTFDYPTIQDKYKTFKNTAHVAWKNENGKDENSTSSKELDPDQFTKANGFKYGIYNAQTKEITWYIGLNYNNVTIGDPYITDVLKDNQKFVPGSIEVRHMLLTGSPDGATLGDLVDPNQYTMETPTESNKNTLKIHFKNKIDSPYYISFKTTVENEFITKEYTNIAELKDGTKNISSVTGSTTVTHGGEFVDKSAKQDGNYIDWTVNINRSQSTLENAKIIDHPTDNQILAADSFQLYGTKVEENGTLTKDPEQKLEQGKDYTLQINTNNETGKQTFELTFLNKIDRAYILEYKTLIYADNGEKVSNKVKLSGSKITNEQVETSEEIIVKTSGGSGTGGSKRGNFELKKVDVDGKTPLADAEFTLYDKDGKNVIRTVSTDKDGIAKFNNLRYGTYVVKETKAPKGYVISDELESGKTITLDDKNPSYTFENEKFVGKVELEKVDSKSGEQLKGAVFTLQDQNGNTIPGYEKVTTNDNGKIIIDDLQPGDYQFKEIKAPTHYDLDEKPITFTVGKKQTTVITKQAKNSLTKGSAILMKKGEDSDAGLAGAVFNIIDKNGDLVKKNVQTGPDGTFQVDNLEPGTYYFVETKAPTHYDIKKEPIEFTIEKSQKEPITVTVINELSKIGSVILTKTGEDHTGGLQDAVFSLQDKDGNDLKTNLKTDANGQITVQNLKPGSYQFVETKAPAHYELNKIPIPFKIEKGQTELLPIFAHNTLTRGGVILTKVDADSNKTLEGAVFKILDKDGNEIRTDLTTNAGGQVVVSDLKPGDYTFVETKAPTHYDLSTDPIPFTIEKSQTELASITATNSLTTGGVSLTKVDADSNETLEGAVFKIVDKDGNDIRTNLTTDQNGKITVSDLKPGDYSFVETKAPTHYDLSTEPIPFTIEKSQKELALVTATNSLTTGGVSLTKVDADSNETLEGAVFKIVDKDGNDVRTGLTTDKHGKTTVSDLKPGDYQLVETKAPTHYDLSTDPIPFTVEKNQKELASITAKNSLTKGGVSLTKVDADSNEALEGAVFKIVDKDGNDVRTDLTTDKHGKITVSDLKPGDYSFVETKAPTHYDLSTEPIPFTIEKGQTELASITAKNSLTKGGVSLTKVDADSNETLEGAVFKIIDSQGNDVHANLTTGKDGKVTVSDLKPGNYQFVETKAPHGYELDPTPIAFTIAKGQKDAIEVIATNKKIVNEQEDSNETNPNGNVSTEESSTNNTSNNNNVLPNTGGQDRINFIIAGFMLLLAGAFSLLATRRKSDSN